MTSSTKAFAQGAWDTLPLIVAAAPFGMVFGALAIGAGLTQAQALGISLIVFAGSAQFIAATLIGAGAWFPAIIATVFVVNLRHLLYATNLMPQVQHVAQRWRIPMAFWLTDETFATVSNRLKRDPDLPHFRSYYLGSAVAMYLLWQVNTLVGIWAGAQIPDIANWGLDVAMVVAFVGIVVPMLVDRATLACAMTSGIAMLLTHDWPNQIGLFASALIAIAVGVLVRERQS